ncbi:MAG: ATP-dependent Clp protease ATP-binding subunit ClpC, partial [Saprospiraceae bacterium]
MPIVTINIPTLIKNAPIDNVEHYHLRPLFFNHPIATHRRFSTAETKYKTELKNYFRGYNFERANSHQLLWYLFSPEIEYKIYDFKFTVSKQFMEGHFGVANFELKGQTFISLPGFFNYMFIGKKDEFGEVDVKKEAEGAIKYLIKSYKKEEKSGFDITRFYSDKKEFVKTVTHEVRINNGKFGFEKGGDMPWFASIGGSTEFDGGMELERVAQDLNGRYPEELHRAHYQEKLVAQLSKIIYQKENTPLVIVGENGVGKHTIIEEVIYRYESDFYKKTARPKQRIWHLNPNRVIAGMSIVGMWEKRFEAILKFVQKPFTNSALSDKIIVDNPVALLRIGRSASNSLTLSNVLKSYLEKRSLQVILLATPEEWKVVQEQDRSFSDLFQVVRLQEPDLETAVKIVLEQRKALELENDVEINIQAIHQLFTIQRNYLKNKPLPGSVMKLLTQLATKHKFSTVDAQEVRDEFKAFSGLQERIFDEQSRLEKDEVRDVISQNLVGQKDAVDALANAVHLIKAKLTNKDKPLSSFLFIGPTGVGKTQGAKVLCQYLMGSEENLLRFDMNEYIDESALDRLIGDYSNPEGQLTGKVRYRPFGVVLFDEIEKAHPKVHDLLLQVLDDGRLTDSLGRTVDFSNTIIIMTSNVGAREVSLQLGYATQSRNDSAIYRKALENKFRPEFINRIDQIVVFNPLSFEHILNIARLQIKELLKRDGFVRRTTILNISQDALEWVAKRGFDEQMGGRALKRQIERDLTVLSAEQLISTYSESPIIFDILFKNGQLVPHIQPLEFVEPIDSDWLPEMPDETEGRRFYNQLLKSIEHIENSVSRHDPNREENDDGVIVIGSEGGKNLNWQHYDFKDKMAVVKDEVITIRLGFSDRYFREAPAIPLRLKRGRVLLRREEATKGMRENYKDQLFQKEALKELSEAYEFAPQQFDSLKTEFVNNFLNVAFLKIAMKGFLQNRVDKISLQFESAIVGMGKAEIAFLMNLYEKLFVRMDVTHEVKKTQKEITAEGHSLLEILQGEAGIHLFYKAHQNPLPIKLIITDLDAKRKKRPIFKVIRIYDGNNTLTDLRTGFTNDVQITADEFKLLLFGGVKERVRRELRV